MRINQKALDAAYQEYGRYIQNGEGSRNAIAHAIEIYDSAMGASLKQGESQCKEGSTPSSPASECHHTWPGKRIDMQCQECSQKSNVIMVRSIIDDVPHIAGKGVKFKLRYLEYENDDLKCSTGPIDVHDVTVVTGRSPRA